MTLHVPSEVGLSTGNMKETSRQTDGETQELSVECQIAVLPGPSSGSLGGCRQGLTLSSM